MSNTRQLNAPPEYGWKSVPRSQEAVFKLRTKNASAQTQSIDELPVPSSQLAKAVQEYARKELIPETFHHSMRVYHYGMTLHFLRIVRSQDMERSDRLYLIRTGKAILRDHFPEWQVSDETYFITCMLHDIGTTSKNISGTYMSFEFYGAKVAYEELISLGSPVGQAEGVMEAIIRHQDLGDTGTITELGQIIQLATVFDNVGMNPDLIKKELIESVTDQWKRNGWSGCFASTIRKEIGLKPYCHTTVIEGFAEKVEGNSLMEPYE